MLIPIDRCSRSMRVTRRRQGLPLDSGPGRWLWWQEPATLGPLSGPGVVKLLFWAWLPCIGLWPVETGSQLL